MVSGTDPIERAKLDALKLFEVALRAVNGRTSVARALTASPWEHSGIHVVAVGKAAEAMALGAREAMDGRIRSGLVITKHGHAGSELSGDPRFTLLESDHPLPGPASFRAGAVLLRFLKEAPTDAALLFLLSGGASSLVEVPVKGLSPDDYRRVNEWLLGSGLDIHQINAVRKRLSAIKGGGLIRFLDGRDAQCLLISDVPGDDPASVGSGPLILSPVPPLDDLDGAPGWLREILARCGKPASGGETTVPHRIVASNALARGAAREAAQSLGYAVMDHEALLTGETLETGRRCAQRVRDGAPGVYLWGGETTLRLPANPGRGGRNQSLALSAALELRGSEGCLLLAAGTDGTDGPTEDAGALVDGGTVQRGEAQGLEAEDCLDRADAGTFLAASGDLLRTGPTGTNVMDLVIGLKAS
ncbi:MAG: glycerate kinase [Gammaproteobacteria bacterium]